MKKIINVFFILLTYFPMVQVFADSVNPYEIMFLNCTGHTIHVTNGTYPPYKFSMDPHFQARNGFSPSYSFEIPAQFIYKHPITIYENGYKDGAMHMFFSGGINSEVDVTLIDDEYVNFQTDTRYIELVGYNNNWVLGRGNRAILGLGCSANSLTNGPSKIENFKIKIK